MNPAGHAEENVALKKYRKGMRDLGRSLIVLAAFQLVAGFLILLPVKFQPEILILLGGMIAVHLTLGVLILRGYGWGNYLVAIWAALLLVTSLFAMGMQADQKPGAGSNPGGCLGLIIAAGLLYYSIKNASRLRKIRAASHRRL